ncbi:MAG TPA: hypothetical protein VN285_01845 [Candidatus Deferrimicrobium sp.]|nr:hypothetical protein [Candidatus Deferrimicrobium sp.]
MSLLKNTVLASIGAIKVTKARAEKIIDDLIMRGELEESDRKKAIMELVEKAEKSTASLRAKVAKEAGKAQKQVSHLAADLKDYQLVKRSEMQKLQNTVEGLTRAVAALQKQLAEKKQGNS